VCLESFINGVWVLEESYTLCVVTWRVLYRVCVCLENLIQSVWVFEKSYTRCVGAWRVLYRLLVWKPEGNVPLGKCKRRRENIIKMDFQEVRCSAMS